jgi:hypothetical protein
MSQSPSLMAALKAVCDPGTFLIFVKELIADREDEVQNEKTNPSSPYGPGANGWENWTIEAFLESAVAWAEDSDFGVKQGLSSENPWRQFANFLYLGKIYE